MEHHERAGTLVKFVHKISWWSCQVHVVNCGEWRRNKSYIFGEGLDFGSGISLCLSLFYNQSQKSFVCYFNQLIKMPSSSTLSILLALTSVLSTTIAQDDLANFCAVSSLLRNALIWLTNLVSGRDQPSLQFQCLRFNHHKRPPALHRLQPQQLDIRPLPGIHQYQRKRKSNPTIHLPARRLAERILN